MPELPFFPNLARRAEMAEKMDLSCSSLYKLENTLFQFDTINRFLTRVRSVLKGYVLDAMKPGREYHLVDLGAGACETAAWLLSESRSRGLNLRISACDHDRRVFRFACQRFGHVPGLDILQRDIMSIDELKDADFIFANHLLHHLNDSRIVELFDYLTEFERATLLISDLKRSRAAYTAYYLVSPLFSRQSYARYDGLLSIRKGFLSPELLRLAHAADPHRMDMYRVEQLFPARILLIRRPIAY